MELGQRIRQARLEAGLSQRQLCGDEITRNMLSQIENGSAHPSMTTLRYLAERLGKSISYFLEEEAVTSPNQSVMAQARQSYDGADYEAAAAALAEYRHPDPVFDREKWLLEALVSMKLAEKALEEGRIPYAVQLLDAAGTAGEKTCYYGPELQRQRLLLLAQAEPQKSMELAHELPADDRELLLRAAAALESGEYARCRAVLDAAEDQQSPQWNFLRGEIWWAEKQYAPAAECYRKAETLFPKKIIPRLEQCYRELEDYKMAYEYACKQR